MYYLLRYMRRRFRQINVLELGDGMETKDSAALVISALAFVVSCVSLWVANFYKPSSAVLSMTSQDYSPELLSNGLTTAKPRRNIYYCLSNTGKQSLYVKEVSVLRGPSRLGYLNDHREYAILSLKNKVEPFVIAPGELVSFKVVHDRDFANAYRDDPTKKFELVSLELMSANGKRYQMCHNITGMPTHGIQLEDPLYDGVPLGRPARSSWYI
jgi:hypothetical protein